MNNTCPKCGTKISPFYMKENCPNCNVNLLYYNMDKRLMDDEANAKKEVDAVNRFIDMIKRGTVASPILIVRLVLFFTPLASMCMPMYDDISLISLIIGLIKGSLTINSVLMPLVSMALVIVLSLAVIISSLFSATKNGFVRNIIFSIINSAVFIIVGVIIGGMGIGWYVTLCILTAEIILHIACKRVIKNNREK